MSWHFNEMFRGDLNVDPTEQEFFATETLRGITDALVREAIQNSLDAAADQKVRVRFYRGQAEAVAWSRYLGDLWPHVEAAREASTPLPSRDAPLEFLVVEDEGTRGLEGDPEQFEDDESGKARNDFYYFWRNVGRSRKESTELGRWGLGKTVFAAASSLNAFFGLTQRRSDGRQLLMGQAVLKIHRLHNRRYRPYGFYGFHENGFTIPIEDSRAIREFVQTFGLRRSSAGLSIVIPYPDEEITVEGLLESVLRHYFHPLVADRLEVEIQDHDAAPILLRQGSLEREIRRRDSLRPLLPLIELARWGLNPEPDAVATLHAPDAKQAPKLTEYLFEKADLDRLRQRYDNRRRLVVECRLPVTEKGELARETRFRLLIEREEQDQRGEGYFVRQGITVENANVRRPRGARWILVVDDPILSTFLGDAENPAHTEWQRSSPKFKEKYVRGPSTLDFVKSAPANVLSLLSQPVQTRDPDLLRHIFSLPGDAALPSPQHPEAKQEGREERTVEEAIPGILGKDGTLVLEKVRTGFRLRGRVGGVGPRRLEILVAYDVLRGDPFQRYSPLDFRMDKAIAVHARGTRIVMRQENRLVIEIETPEFEVLAMRFDENRDLRVKVRPAEEG